MKINFKGNVKLLEAVQHLLLLFVLSIFVSSVSAQDKNARQDNIKVPSEETFKPADGLIEPGRNTMLMSGNAPIDASQVSLQNIYDRDGSVWYQFSMFRNSPLSIDKNEKKGFKPFSLILQPEEYDYYLRLVNESKHWYEVEINEDTRETKFIRKSDIFINKTDFLSRDGVGINAMVKVDNRETSLLDKPDGNKIDDYIPSEINEYFVWEVDGDWIKIALSNDLPLSQRPNGWVRWRDGRKILVGCLINNWSVV